MSIYDRSLSYWFKSWMSALPYRDDTPLPIRHTGCRQDRQRSVVTCWKVSPDTNAPACTQHKHETGKRKSGQQPAGQGLFHPNLNPTLTLNHSRSPFSQSYIINNNNDWHRICLDSDCLAFAIHDSDCSPTRIWVVESDFPSNSRLERAHTVQ